MIIRIKKFILTYLFFIICFLTNVMAQVSLKPEIITFSEPVNNAFSLPFSNSAAIEIFVSTIERQFAIVNFLEDRQVNITKIPLDEYKSATKSVLGMIDERNLLILSTSQICILNLEENRITNEYTTPLTVPTELTPQYFMGKLATKERPLVIAEMQPSVGQEGILDPTLHSLVYEDILARKTLSKIVLEHPLKEIPPVFWGKEIIIFKNKRKDISEPYKALDNTLSQIEHPLCDVLNNKFKNAYIWGLVFSEKFKQAIVFCRDIQTSIPFIFYVWWGNNIISPFNFGSKMLIDIKNLMLSLDQRWVFYTATFREENKIINQHYLLSFDELNYQNFAPIFLLDAKPEDRMCFISGPERIALFRSGQILLWKLPKILQKKSVAKPKATSKISTKRKK